MTDFETHPVGTADLVKRLRAGKNGQEIEAADRIEQLEAQAKERGVFIAAVWSAVAFTADRTVAELRESLTRANAATAAAYEAAAQVALLRHDENQTMRATRATPKLTGLDDVAEEIRALAAPDQTAALDRMITVAEARGMERAAGIVNTDVQNAQPEMTRRAQRLAAAKAPGFQYAIHRADLDARISCRDKILAASKKGGA